MSQSIQRAFKRERKELLAFVLHTPPMQESLVACFLCGKKEDAYEDVYGAYAGVLLCGRCQNEGE